MNASSRLGAPQAATGCAVLELTCVAITTEPGTILTFFSTKGDDLGQAASGTIGSPAVGTLLCNEDQEWTYTQNISGILVTNAVNRAECMG